MDFNAELARFTADSTLPDWVQEAVKGIVNAAQKSARSNIALDAAHTELRAANIKIQALTLELAHHRRMRFGTKSEALSVDQLDLFIETLESDRAELETRINAKVEPNLPKVKRRVAGRQPLPAHLERVIHRHSGIVRLRQMWQALVKIGEDVTEQLDVEPARFFVHQHIGSHWACRACETVTAQPIAPAIIDGGMAAPGLLSWVSVCKFVDHLPLYRVEQIFLSSAMRFGIMFSILYFLWTLQC
ncbi:MAG: hypothetical protein HHJ12_12880 [Glaciimonas sp.]|nr:hypothetical protein [Glaciimonas sp.]